MKILLSAIACDPYRGSEAHFGWNALRVLASRHEVWVLGHGHDTESMQRAREEGLIGDNVRFLSHGEWGQRHRNRILSRIQNWRDYQLWSRSVLNTALRLDSEIGFDVAHHVTLSTWRVPSLLWKLRCPFVWGPIGGAEVFPLRLLPVLSPASAVYELVRRFQNQLAMASHSLRSCIHNSAYIFASTPETLQLVRRLGAPVDRTSLLSAAFFSEHQVAHFARETDRSRPGSPLRIFAGGDIEGRKGHALALRALALCKKQGIDFCYHIAGQGPEIGHLQKLTRNLGIADRVKITPHLQRDEYLDALQSSQIYLLPSLRDNAPVTLMEAMLCGCTPVVIACGGPGWIVEPECGITVPICGENEMVQKIYSALRMLNSESSRRKKMGQNARLRVRKDFSESAYTDAMEAACQKVQSLR